MSGLQVRCEQLRQVYQLDEDEVVALSDIDLVVPAGSTAAIVGPSGSGKSTLMTVLAGLQRPTAGEVYVGDTELTALSERELLRVRAEQLAVVVQNPNRNLLPYADAAANIRFAQRGARSYGRSGLPDPAGLLERLGLAELGGSPADRLSGGERQRLSLAVGMAAAPGVLLADEPTSQLDTGNRDRVVALLHRINAEFGTTVIVVTHDHAVTSDFQRTVSLESGRVREESLP
jgi:ABC-type lipoprotein export system ATPase subunit